MLRRTRGAVSLVVCCVIATLGTLAIRAQQQSSAPAPATENQGQKPLYTSEQDFLRWPLSPSEKEYATIDGNHLHQYVEELAAISRHYRDQGHQFWGRIDGTESDVENQRWLLEKFRKAGLSNVHEQPLDLPPQWMPQSWSVTVRAGGKTLRLATAQPTYGTPGTSPDGLDLEAVYAGLGSEADFAGRDVRGKAVFLFSMPLPSMLRHSASIQGGVKRAEQKGAAAIFIVLTLPGNIRTQMYPQGTNIPTFSTGLDDGTAVRDLIGQTSPGQLAHVSVHLDVKTVSDLKTATIWGELPGMTDENIMIIGHRDGYFEGGTDDASGVATMLGLAEYFAKIPKQQRRRTILFLGTSGHHGAGGSPSSIWLSQHKEQFAKTALLINCEHTAAALTYPSAGGEVAPTGGANALFWYAGGSARVKEIAVKSFDAFGIVRYSQMDPAGHGEIGVAAVGPKLTPPTKYAPSIMLLDIGMFNHSDRETADVVPATGLAAASRAYARIITEVNKLDRKDIVAAPDAPDSR